MRGGECGLRRVVFVFGGAGIVACMARCVLVYHAVLLRYAGGS